MGQRPTHRNESQHVTPAKAGVHVREELDSRFRGNDAAFDGALGAPETLTNRAIPRAARDLALILCPAIRFEAERDSSPATAGSEWQHYMPVKTAANAPWETSCATREIS
jgi:hypothetical protein